MPTETENVKNDRPVRRRKQASSTGPKLSRTTFRTSREMDFFSERELVGQTGHGIGEWPLVFLKETIDNALDACEDAGVAPMIKVAADAGGIAVSDNGPGLPESTLTGALDFTVRVSSREAYVAPDRGAQGNALKTLLPMPHVIDPQHGRLIVAAHGKRHLLTCGADPITQQAAIDDDVSEVATDGTEIRIEWKPDEDGDGDVLWPFDSLLPQYEIADRFRGMVEGFTVFNPHLTITLDWFGETTQWNATNRDWRKWKPNQPTSAHWYELRHLKRLVGAYISHDRQTESDRPVSELVKEFDGLSSSQKRSRVLDDSSLKRARLSHLVVGGELDAERIGALLAAMKRHTRPVKPKALGVIGEDHLRERLLCMGANLDSVRYKRVFSKNEIPHVVETAFGYLGEESDERRRIYTGANWSATITNPFRTFGGIGGGLESVLADLKAGTDEPIVFAVHLAQPRLEYADRGKSSVVLPQ